MKHGKKFNTLSRKKGHRRALMMNMSNALIKNKRINTTLAKAKALRQHLEPIITRGKNDTMHNRRVVFKYLNDKHMVGELFGPIAEKIGDRPGGYLRIIKTGFRDSDGAELAMIEFVDYNDVYKNVNPNKSGGGRRRRRRRRGSGSGSTAANVGNQEEE